MKVIRENRTLKLSELPERTEGCVVPAELEIEIRYVDPPKYPPGRCACAIQLDNFVIPAIVRGLKMLEATRDFKAN